jgi:hypothetical protein
VILEPHLGLAMLVWRASVPLGKKLNSLREVRLGDGARRARPADPKTYREGKPVFAGMDAAIRWIRKQRGGPA